MAKSKSDSGVNKAEMIRETARSMGKTVRPRDIIAALKEKGIVVSSPQVSKTLKAAGFQRKSRSRKSAAAKSARRTAPREPPPGTADRLIAARLMAQ